MYRHYIPKLKDFKDLKPGDWFFEAMRLKDGSVSVNMDLYRFVGTIVGTPYPYLCLNYGLPSESIKYPRVIPFNINSSNLRQCLVVDIVNEIFDTKWNETIYEFKYKYIDEK